MATGELRKLRHTIRDIVGDTAVYNGLAGKPGLPISTQRNEFETVIPRIGQKAASLRSQAEELVARAEAFEAKAGEVQTVVDQANAILDDREQNGVRQPAQPVESDEEVDFEDDEEFDEDDLAEEEVDFNEEEEPSLKDKVKNALT